MNSIMPTEEIMNFSPHFNVSRFKPLAINVFENTSGEVNVDVTGEGFTATLDVHPRALIKQLEVGLAELADRQLDALEDPTVRPRSGLVYFDSEPTSGGPF